MSSDACNFVYLELKCFLAISLTPAVSEYWFKDLRLHEISCFKHMIRENSMQQKAVFNIVNKCYY